MMPADRVAAGLARFCHKPPSPVAGRRRALLVSVALFGRDNETPCPAGRRLARSPAARKPRSRFLELIFLSIAQPIEELWV